MVIGIAHNAFRVTDMEKALEFYCGGLGFTKAFELADSNGKPWIVYIKVSKNTFIELFYGGEEQAKTQQGTAGFVHMCLECDDVYATVADLEARGVQIDSAPKVGSDKNTQAWIHDPDGNKIELMSIDPSSPQANA